MWMHILSHNDETKILSEHSKVLPNFTTLFEIVLPIVSTPKVWHFVSHTRATCRFDGRPKYIPQVYIPMWLHHPYTYTHKLAQQCVQSVCIRCLYANHSPCSLQLISAKYPILEREYLEIIHILECMVEVCAAQTAHSSESFNKGQMFCVGSSVASSTTAPHRIRCVQKMWNWSIRQRNAKRARFTHEPTHTFAHIDRIDA